MCKHHFRHVNITKKRMETAKEEEKNEKDEKKEINLIGKMLGWIFNEICTMNEQ